MKPSVKSFINDYQHYVIRYSNKYERIAAVVGMIDKYYADCKDDIYQWIDENVKV